MCPSALGGAAESATGRANEEERRLDPSVATRPSPCAPETNLRFSSASVRADVLAVPSQERAIDDGVDRRTKGGAEQVVTGTPVRPSATDAALSGRLCSSSGTHAGSAERGLLDGGPRWLLPLP